MLAVAGKPPKESRPHPQQETSCAAHIDRGICAHWSRVARGLPQVTPAGDERRSGTLRSTRSNTRGPAGTPARSGPSSRLTPRRPSVVGQPKSDANQSVGHYLRAGKRSNRVRSFLRAGKAAPG
jgi:hypothetical protein